MQELSLLVQAASKSISTPSFFNKKEDNKLYKLSSKEFKKKKIHI